MMQNKRSYIRRLNMATVVPSIGLKGIEGYTVFVEVQMVP